MDILKRKLLNVGDECYFLRASVENPFVYLRFKGVVARRYTNDDLVSYHIRITEIIEDKKFLNSFINRKKFRVFNNTNGRTYNMSIYVYDIIDEPTFNSKLTRRYSNKYFDVHSALVFSTETEMASERDTILKHLKSNLTESLDFVNEQITN